MTFSDTGMMFEARRSTKYKEEIRHERKPNVAPDSN